MIQLTRVKVNKDLDPGDYDMNNKETRAKSGNVCTLIDT